MVHQVVTAPPCTWVEPLLRSSRPASWLEGSPMRGTHGLILRSGVVAGALTLLAAGAAAVAGSVPAVARTTHGAARKAGSLDCNRFSRIQGAVKLTRTR